MVLEDGATLQALPNTVEGNNLSISIATTEYITQCNSHEAVFKYTSATHQSKAKLSVATNKHDVVFPGLTYRGKCKNNKSMANEKSSYLPHIFPPPLMATTPRTWIDVQIKTFTAWANSVLKEKHLVLEDLDGLRDGVLLINLLEALSGSQVGKYCKAPKTRVQQIENVTIAIQYMQVHQVKLHCIGAPDIVDGNPKLTLGLLWALISRYQLSTFGSELPQTVLLSWIKVQLRCFGIEVWDFVHGWQDGRALCALINSIAAGSIPMDSLTKDPFKDTERAVTTAHDLFAIPKILDPQDLIACPDELSIITYLSYYARFAIEKAKKLESDEKLLKATAKRAFMERRASIQTVQEENERELARNAEQAQAAKDNKIKEALVAAKKVKEEQKATTERAAKQKAEEEAQKLAEARSRQEQRRKTIDISKVYIYGSCAVHCNEEANFQIHACNAYGQQVKDCGDIFSVRVIDHLGSLVNNSICNNCNGTFTVTYRPTNPGEHKIEVLYNAQHIKGSPFSITISKPATTTQRPSAQFAQKTPAEEYSTAYFGEVKLEIKIDEFAKEFAQLVQPETETTEITQAGGSMVLEDGAMLQALPDTSSEGSSLSIAIATSDATAQCSNHDIIEGGTTAAVYNCLPHGEEFSLPVLLKIPYDTTIPIDQLAVFHMRAMSDGQPCGVWTRIEAQFTGNTAMLLTTHFSYYAVFKFNSATHQKKAKLSRANKKYDVVFPGLTYRGSCRNNACEAFQKDVNCAKGFGNFAPGDEVDQQSLCATCPLCERGFTPTKFILHDTKVLVTYEDDMGIRKEIPDDISADNAVCYGMANAPTRALEKFMVKCDPRPGYHYGIDICFVMDCTGSMGQYIEEAKQQIQGMAASLREDVRKLGLGCKIRIGFVGYRDYTLTPSGTVESNDDLLYTAELTEDLNAIVIKVGEQRAFGGDDACEHIVGGLREAVNMEWMGSMRVIVLVADAPCHGAEFHDAKILDNFPTGDPSGEHPQAWIERMLKKDINFFFLKITSHTDIMLQKFRSFYDSHQANLRGRKIEDMHMGEQATIMGTLIKSGIMRSIGNIT